MLYIMEVVLAACLECDIAKVRVHVLDRRSAPYENTSESCSFLNLQVMEFIDNNKRPRPRARVMLSVAPSRVFSQVASDVDKKQQVFATLASVCHRPRVAV
jgi:hypothetical protein